MLRDVNHNSSHFEDCCIVGLQSTLGAVQGLRLGNVALYHRSETQSRTMSSQTGNWTSYSIFMWWGYLDGCKMVKHHASSLFGVQVNTQNNDTMNESRGLCTTEAFVVVGNILYVETCGFLENTERVRVRELKIIDYVYIWLFRTGECSFAQKYVFRHQSPTCWVKEQMGDRPVRWRMENVPSGHEPTYRNSCLAVLVGDVGKSSSLCE